MIRFKSTGPSVDQETMRVDWATEFLSLIT